MGSLIKDTFFGFSSDIVLTIVKILKLIVLVPLVIYYTSADAYGFYLVCLSIIGVLGIVDLSTDLYLIKILSDPKKINLISPCINIVILNSFIIFLAGITIFHFNIIVDSKDQNSIVFLFLLLGKFLTKIASVPNSFLLSKRKMGFINIIKIIVYSIEIHFLFLFLYYNYGILALGILEVATSSLFLIIFAYKVRINLSKFLKIDFYNLKYIMKNALYYYFSKLSNIGITNADNLLINYMLGPSFVTVYNISIKLPTLISREIAGKVSTNLFPVLTNIDINTFKIKLSKVYTLILKLSIRIGILFGIYNFFINEKFIEIWVGSEFYGGNFLNFIFSLMIVAEIFYTSFEPLILSKGNMKLFSIISMSELILNILLSLFLSKYFGLLGIALGSFISRILLPNIFMIYSSNNIFNNKVISFKLIFKTLLFSTPCFVSSLIIFNNSEFLGSYLFVIIFSLQLIIINLISFDYKIIFNKKKIDIITQFKKRYSYE